MSFCFLQLGGIPIFEQLQLEEALLRLDERNWFIVNDGSPPAIVMGISGTPRELIDVKKMDAAPLPLIKRFSGGGTVVVDENTLFATFICQKDLNLCPHYPEPILQWTARFYKEALGLDVFALKENDYILGEKKCAGNAQYIRKNRWLHHTTFLWDYDPKQMDYLLMPNKQPSYRKQRTHSDFLTPLHPHLENRKAFFDRCQRELVKRFYIEECTYPQIKSLIADKEHRRATQMVDLFS